MKKKYEIKTKYFDLEITPFCWGVGFDIGVVYLLGFSVWLGPIYLYIHTKDE